MFISKFFDAFNAKNVKTLSAGIESFVSHKATASWFN